MLAGLPPLQAVPDAPDAEKKPSLVRRMFGGDDKKKAEEKAPEPEPRKPAKSKSVVSEKDKEKPGKPKSVASEKAKPAKAKSIASDEDKPASKPKSRITLTVRGDGSLPVLLKSEDSKTSHEAAAGKKPARAKERDLDSEFGKTGDESPLKPVTKVDDQPRPTTAPSPAGASAIATTSRPMPGRAKTLSTMTEPATA